MKYHIRAGRLFPAENGQTVISLASIQNPFYSVRRTILSPEGRAALFTDIRADGRGGKAGHQYIITDPQRRVVLSGKPECSADDDPDHIPRADRVQLKMNQSVYKLRMLNSQNYCLEDAYGQKAVEIIHDGIGGGWTVETYASISPTLLLGIFIFSRYLDKENKFVVI
jgi:hypothetical protein